MDIELIKQIKISGAFIHFLQSFEKKKKKNTKQKCRNISSIAHRQSKVQTK